MVQKVRATHVLQCLRQKEESPKGGSKEKKRRRTESGLEKPEEGGFGSNHKVASCGEKSNSVRTNRPSPRGI